MAKILIGIVAALACLLVVESLDCNECTASLFGFCLGASNATCGTNETCFTSLTTFSAISSFKGFSDQGCTAASTCNGSASATSNGSLPLVGLSYSVKVECCSTDRCNPIDLSGATSVTMSLSVLSVAALSAMWGSFM